MNKTAFLFLTLPLALAAACGSDDDPAPEPEPPPELRATTYNLGLALGFVEATAARAPLTIERLAELETDILCVQEVWRPVDEAALVAATSEALPNSSFIAADPGELGDVPCAEGETDELLTCIEGAGCDMVCIDKLASCGLQNCSAELFAVSDSCLGCIQANIGSGLDEILSTCEEPAISYAYGGSFGIGLLTSYDVASEDEIVLESTTNRRGVLYAELDTPFGAVHAFCTHLTAVFSDLDYPGMFGSWEEEQSAQIDALLAFIEDKAGAEGQILVMGDFNTGPEGPGYIAEVPANYDKLLSGGLGNPYTTTPGHECTFCDANPIVAKEDSNDDDTSSVIDHVLIDGFTSGSGAAERVMAGAIEVENCDETIQTAYSDHYGVRLTITGEAP